MVGGVNIVDSSDNHFYNGMVRLNSDGSADTTFDQYPGGMSRLSAFIELPDGRLIVGRNFGNSLSYPTADGGYRLVASVSHTALDGEPDGYPADDVCPHGPQAAGTSPPGKVKDKGCGGKGAPGSELILDVVLQ